MEVNHDCYTFKSTFDDSELQEGNESEQPAVNTILHQKDSHTEQRLKTSSKGHFNKSSTQNKNKKIR